jgi:hypothetical protein
MYCAKHTDTPLTGRKDGLFGTELMESMDKDDKDLFESLELFCGQCERDLDIQRRKEAISKVTSMDEVSISDLCYNSYPCKHNVSIHGERFLMNGVDIYKLQKRLTGNCKDFTKGSNAHTEHFAMYAKFAKDRDS